MRHKLTAAGLVLLLCVAAAAFSQTPRVVRYSGVVRDAAGAVRTGPASLTFAIYAEAEGGVALWTETQAVTLDAEGRYAVALGGTVPEGLPLALFTQGEARWLGLAVDGGPEAARVALVSVPYALKAADADTVGGKPLSAFVLAGEKTGTGADGLTYVNPVQVQAALPTANSGTAGYLGKFTNTVDLGNSALFQAGTSIGLNTTTPLASLHIAAPTAPSTYFDVYAAVLGALPAVNRAARGTPAAPTAVQLNDILGGLAVRGYGTTGFGAGVGQVMFRAAEAFTDTAQGTFLQMTTTPIGSNLWVERLRIDSAGRVGIGTTAPTALLHVAGDAVVDGNIAAKYQDVAEWVESGTPLAPGTIVVVDPAVRDGVRPSTRAYDVGVAGAISAQPGVVLGEKGASKSLVAQSGRVKVKVDARYGRIQAGDLLVTSPTPGHAMRSKPLRVHGVPVHRPGTIVGKALEPLAKGTGEILVLLTLQ